MTKRRLSLLKRVILQLRMQSEWLRAGEPELSVGASSIDVYSKNADGTETPRFVDWQPDPLNVARAFEGEWSSAVPGLPSGKTPLFDDSRVKWFEERLGGFAGRNILELGPLEGGHTYMMTQRGATVTAIESNVRAWLRCLAVKEYLGTNSAKFLLGDFTKYLASKPPRFDFVVASGVLYHMIDPVSFLEGVVDAAENIGIWTHYFDQPLLLTREDLRQKFDFIPRNTITRRERKIDLYDQKYLKALEWKGFCGGAAQGSAWLTRDGIFGILSDEGFVCETAFEQPDHPNGPAFCVFARRR